MAEYKFHEFADLFPLLEGEQFEELVQDIKARGLQSRIVLYEDAIPDGRNRYRACLKAGVEPRYELFNGRDPLAHIISLNMQRRHLDETQRAIVAGRIARFGQGRPKTGKFAPFSPTQAGALKCSTSANAQLKAPARFSTKARQSS